MTPLRWLAALSLRAKLVFTLTVAVALLLGLSTLSSLRYWEREASEAARSQALVAARSLRAAVEAALAYDRPEQAHRNLRRLAEGGQALGARVYAGDGTVLLSSVPEEEGRRRTGVWIPRATELPPEGVARTSPAGNVVAYLPVGSARAEVIEVTFSLEPLRAAVDRGVRLGVGLLAATLLAMGAVVYTMVQREVVRPLERLDGLLGEEAGRPGELEVRRLTASVERLVEREVEAERSLEEQRRRLAAREGLARVGELAAEMAHELKRPLSNVRTAVELLEQEYRLENGGRDLLEEVDRQLGRLGETMGDLFSLARPVEIASERIEAETLLEETLLELAGNPALRGLELEFGAGAGIPPLRGDRQRLRQALSNLVLNAAEATPAGGRVRVRALRSEEGGVVLRVEDTGPGIPPGEREAVLRPFYSTKPTGTGLGLPLVARIAAAHGGSLLLEDGPEGGTVAEIRLPAEAVREGRGP